MGYGGNNHGEVGVTAAVVSPPPRGVNETICRKLGVKIQNTCLNVQRKEQRGLDVQG